MHQVYSGIPLDFSGIVIGSLLMMLGRRVKTADAMKDIRRQVLLSGWPRVMNLNNLRSTQKTD